MKLNYYGYYFYEVAKERRILMSIKDFLIGFCNFDNATFKNTLIHNDEKIFLLNQRSDLFLFLKTKDTEIVKTIDKQNISVEEISSRLALNESIGFVSYIMVKSNYIAFASTQLAPSVTAFTSLVNELLTRLNCHAYQFRLNAFTEKLSRGDALKMDFIGSTAIEVNSDSSFFSRIAEVFGATPSDLEDLGTFEVILKPKSRQNIKNISQHLINADNQGIDKLTIRAKNEIADKLTDFRIEGLGIVHDILESSNEKHIYDEIFEKINANDILASKVQDHEQNDDYDRTIIDAIHKFNSSDNWFDIIGDIQDSSASKMDRSTKITN
jgi:hypothetical protein